MPSLVINVIGPEVVAGTIAVSCPKLTFVTVAATPLNRTVGLGVVALVKLAPVRRTLVPCGPKAGENPKMVGWMT